MDTAALFQRECAEIRCIREMLRLPPQAHYVVRVSSSHQLLGTGRKRADTVYVRIELHFGGGVQLRVTREFHCDQSK